MAKARRRHARLIERLRNGRELHSLREDISEGMIGGGPGVAALMMRRRGAGLMHAISVATKNMSTETIRKLVARAQRAGINSPVWNSMLKNCDGRDMKDARELVREGAFVAMAKAGVDATETLTEAIRGDMRGRVVRSMGHDMTRAIMSELGESGGGAAAGGSGVPGDQKDTRKNPVGGLRGYVPSRVKPVGSVTRDPIEEIFAGMQGEKRVQAVGGLQPQPQNWRDREAGPVPSSGDYSPSGPFDDDDDAAADRLQQYADDVATGKIEDEGGRGPGAIYVEDASAGDYIQSILTAMRAAGLSEDDLSTLEDRLNSLARIARGSEQEDETESEDEGEARIRMSEDQEDVFNRDGDEWRPGDGPKFDEEGNPLPDDEGEDEAGRVSAIDTYASEDEDEGVAPTHRASGFEAVAGSSMGQLTRVRTRQAALSVAQRNQLGRPLKRSRYFRPGRIGKTKAQRRKAFSGSATGAVAVIDKILSRPINVQASARGSSIQRAVKESLADFDRSTRSAF